MNIRKVLENRIVVLDGAMGTMIQSLQLPYDAYQWGIDVQAGCGCAHCSAHGHGSQKGNNDALNLLAPEAIASVHQAYVDAGADLITTNTFSSNRISQHEYGLEAHVRDLNMAGARIARRVADSCQERQVLVVGSMGPTSKTLSLSTDMAHPEQRAVGFDDMCEAYREQAEALLEGGVDILLLETCFDALNAKAALVAIQQLNEQRGTAVPVMVSATINDRSGRTLTGQTLEAFYVSISHYPILSFGLNCSFGVQDLYPFVKELAASVPCPISLHPNAGLPNEMGEYDQQPADMARQLRAMAEEGLLNIVGGCCGTTPAHIRAIAEAVGDIAPRRVPERDHRLVVSGLEAVTIDTQTRNFTNIGERTNVAGSRKFARLIAAHQYEEAAQVARQQIENGASVIDINMDDAMLDSRREMEAFVRYIENDPGIARAALMIDSSDWPTILAGLQNAQGKCIVNSISLKNGEADFLGKARQLQQYGAAVVVMAFDEDGQATTYERKIAICQRAYQLLTGIGFRPSDIIFDVNILSVGTGIDEHRDYAVDFIRAVGWIKQHLPEAKTSGGVSNLSFAFRGNNKVREAMHSVFLYHAIRAGLDMAIVNPAMLQVYDDIPADLLQCVEDVVLNRRADATERLTELAAVIKEETEKIKEGTAQPTADWRNRPVDQRIEYALAKGVADYLEADLMEALHALDEKPVAVIEGPLMQGMEHIGQLFGEGKMFLPQIVKAAKVMRQAVDILQPYIETETDTSASSQPRVVLATAKGDVHDIGKNIVGIVLACNGFEVIDLGVMVPAETILAAVREHQPAFVGISGLITPSLKEMENLCRLFQQEGLRLPILVGGATTSALHTAVRLAPLYDGPVIFGGDASYTAVIAKRLVSSPRITIHQLQDEQQQLRTQYELNKQDIISFDEANRRAPRYEHAFPKDLQLSRAVPTLAEAEALIDWRMVLLFWGFRGATLEEQLTHPEAQTTLREAQEHWQRLKEQNGVSLRSQLIFAPARRQGNDIVFDTGQVMPMLRSQSEMGRFQSLADFLPTDHSVPVGLFCATARPTSDAPATDYEGLMTHVLCARLSEAAAEWMHRHIERQLAGTPLKLIRPAIGYPVCPDHTLKRILFSMTEAERWLGVTLTESNAIQPSTTVCGLFIAHPEAHYFSVGRVGDDQQKDYEERLQHSISRL